MGQYSVAKAPPRRIVTVVVIAVSYWILWGLLTFGLIIGGTVFIVARSPNVTTLQYMRIMFPLLTIMPFAAAGIIGMIATSIYRRRYAVVPGRMIVATITAAQMMTRLMALLNGYTWLMLMLALVGSLLGVRLALRRSGAKAFGGGHDAHAG